MGHSYVVPLYMYNIEPITFALIGLAIGFTCWNRRHIRWTLMFLLILGIFNFIFMAPGNKFNWFYTLQTHYGTGQTINTTSYSEKYSAKVPSHLAQFTAEDIGLLFLMLVVVYGLANAWYEFRVRVFKINMFSKGKVHIKEDKWGAVLMEYFSKKIFNKDFFKLSLIYLANIVQVVIPMLIFQMLSIYKVQFNGATVIGEGKWFPYNVIFGLVSYGVCVIGIYILFYLWLIPYVIDPERTLGLSHYFIKKDNLEEKYRDNVIFHSRWMYFFYHLIFLVVVVIYHLLHVAIAAADIIGAGSEIGMVYLIFGFSLLLMVIMCITYFIVWLMERERNKIPIEEDTKYREMDEDDVDVIEDE